MYYCYTLDTNILTGGWHKLKLQISKDDLSINIDGRATKLTSVSLPISFGRTIYFGQSPKVFTAILAGTSLSYEGCIRHITVNNASTKLKDAKRASFSTPLPSPRCQADRCSDSSAKQCSHNGYCVGNNTGLFCHCSYGYSGPNCEYCK